MGLNARQVRFAQEYVVDFNATQAAIRAGYSEASAHVQGCELLKNPNVAKLVEELKEQAARVAGLSAAWVLDRWMEIASANPGELVQVRRTCCRHCNGFGHQYQWTEAEYTDAVNRAIDAGKAAPDGMGGFGFDPKAEPHPDCPECGGEGVAEVHVADTRKKRHPLYAGAERTRNGIKVTLRDQDAAVANLAKYLGMQVDRKEISGPGGAPLAIANLKAEDLTDDQLAAVLGESAE